ncbi:unnamed protein product [Rotaria sordida]|nr:unnamed protein product [Rotaria sordida]CAF1222904.1 unnamed protein product [Rotaria sordida]CAF1503162.1 unnamed protein product [Rotaria sordida]
MFGNPDDHHTFWHCSGSNAYLKYCPKDSIWSQVEQQCIWNNSSLDPSMVCGVMHPIVGFLINKAIGRVLDSNEEKNVYTLKYNGGTYQQWQFQRQDDGSCVLQNLATSLILDSNGYQIYTHNFNGGFYQKWRLYWNEDNFFVLLNLATSRVLDSNFDGQVYPSIGNGGDFQK